MATLPEIESAVYRKDMTLLGELTPDEANLRDQDGRTPLMHAVLAEDATPEVVRLLIERGADVHAADTAQRWTALHFAARDQNEPLVRVLLAAGADIDAVDVFGNTPLWRSVMNAGPSPATTRTLLSHGADPARKNRYGISPADLAHETGLDDIVALFEHPADPADPADPGRPGRPGQPG
jgi:ankyrin repeat protein